MVLPAWFSSGTALLSYHECALSKVDTCPDRTLDLKGHKSPTTNQSPICF